MTSLVPQTILKANYPTSGSTTVTLAVAAAAADTTLQFSQGILDKDGTAPSIETNISITVIDSSNDYYGYVENIKVPAGGFNVAGTVATGVTRGIVNSSNTTTGAGANAIDLPSGSLVQVVFSSQLAQSFQDIFTGTIDTGSRHFKIGDGTTDAIQGFNINTGGANTLIFGADTSGNPIVRLQDGSSFIVSAATGSLTASTGVQLVASDIQIDVSDTDIFRKTPTYTPAYLTGDTGAESAFNNWLAVLDGSFRISIDGTGYNCDAIDFTGVTSMADVASYIQTAIRTATSGLETCVWSTNKFIISSVDTTSSSAITVTETSTGTVGTDISGAGASDWMDCDTGNGTVTAAVVNTVADEDHVVVVNSSGYLDENYIENLKGLTISVAELNQLDGISANVTDTNLNTLTSGTSGDGNSLHQHLNSLGATLGDTYFSYPIMPEHFVLTDCAISALGVGFIGIASSNATWEATNALMGIPGTTAGILFTNGKKTILEFMAYISGGTVGDRSMGLGTSFDGAYNEVTDSAQFTMDGGTLYAKTSDGATATTTDISAGITVTNWNLYRLESDNGVDCKFYVNGTLKATHTTNLPNSGSANIGFGGETNGEDTNISNVIVRQEL